MHKPVRAPIEDDLPSVDSDDEDDDGAEWSSGVEISDNELDSHDPSGLSEDSDDNEDEDGGSSGSSRAPPRRKGKHADSDAEMPYETMPRKRRSSWDPESDEDKGIKRLPIKLGDGRIKESGSKVFLPREDQSSEDELIQDDAPTVQQTRIEDVATGARFGRPAVVDVVGNKSRKARVQAAKEQVASICQDIVADPENSVCSNTLRSSSNTHALRVVAWSPSSTAHLFLTGDINTVAP